MDRRTKEQIVSELHEKLKEAKTRRFDQFQRDERREDGSFEKCVTQVQR